MASDASQPSIRYCRPTRTGQARGDRVPPYRRMIDNFALALTHGLMMLAAWRLLSRRDLDDERPPTGKPPRG